MTNVIKFVRADLKVSESISVDCYMMPSGEKRIGITGAVVSVGRAKNYLTQVTKRESSVLSQLLDLGFTNERIKGSVSMKRGGASIVDSISCSDFKRYLAWEAICNKNSWASAFIEGFMQQGDSEVGEVVQLALKQNALRSRRKNKSEEKRIQRKLAKSLNGQMEVCCKSGDIDILTEDEVIEVKKIQDWKFAMGQVLAYSCEYLDRSPRIHLFGDCTNDLWEVIMATATRFGVAVSFEE